MESEQLLAAYPVSCPRCGCPESSVLKTQRTTQSNPPQPLPVLRRVRKCAHCEKQYRTRETLEEIDLESFVWRARQGKVNHELSEIPDGDYPGEWTRFEVTLTLGDIVWTLDTRSEMRSMSYPCKIHCSRGRITIRSVTEGGE